MNEMPCPFCDTGSFDRPALAVHLAHCAKFFDLVTDVDLRSYQSTLDSAVYTDPNACPECGSLGYVDQGEGCVSIPCTVCRKEP